MSKKRVFQEDDLFNDPQNPPADVTSRLMRHNNALQDEISGLRAMYFHKGREFSPLLSPEEWYQCIPFVLWSRILARLRALPPKGEEATEEATQWRRFLDLIVGRRSRFNVYDGTIVTDPSLFPNKWRTVRPRDETYCRPQMDPDPYRAPFDMETYGRVHSQFTIRYPSLEDRGYPEGATVSPL